MGIKNQYHRQKLREKEFKEKIYESLKAQHQRGLLEGSRAILKVVGDMIAEEGRTTEEKLATVMEFINTSLALTDKTVDEANEKAKETEATFDSLGEDVAADAAAEAAPAPAESYEEDEDE